MKIRNVLGVLLLVAVSSNAFAGAEDMQVYAFGDPGCEYLMSTNIFELAPGESVVIELDVSECTPQQLGTFLYYGYQIKGEEQEHSPDFRRRCWTRVYEHDVSRGIEHERGPHSHGASGPHHPQTLRREHESEAQEVPAALESRTLSPKSTTAPHLRARALRLTQLRPNMPSAINEKVPG